MKAAKLTFALFLVTLIAGPVLGQDSGGPPGGGRGPGGRRPGGMFGGPGGVASAFDRLTDAVKKLDLTTEQKDKIEALKKEYGPQFKALRDKADKILTPEQKTARDAAMKNIREGSREDRHEAFQKLRDAVKLTDDQKKQMGSVMKDGGELWQKVRPKLMEVLTDEQKTKLRESMGFRQGGRRGGRGRGGPGGGQGGSGGSGDDENSSSRST